MRICVAEGEREQHKQLMDNLERRLHANHIVFWLRENYAVGTSGSLSKRSVYNHYLSVTKQVTKKPLISPTFFGKLVKRAFPTIKCNRKGPRGHTKQHYTHLQRISTSQEEERAFPTGDEVGLLPTSPLGSPSSDHSFGTPSPCTPDSAKMFLVPSFAENDEMAYLSCILPGPPTSTMVSMATPDSPGLTSSRSTSPTNWMFHSNPAAPSTNVKVEQLVADQQQQPHQQQLECSPATSSGCLYCDQCQSASSAPAASFVPVQPQQPPLPHKTDADLPFIKQEPLSWLSGEETANTAPSAASAVGGGPSTSLLPAPSVDSFQISGYSSLEQLPIYAMSGPSSPPSVEIALPLDDDWTAFLMDN